MFNICVQADFLISVPCMQSVRRAIKDRHSPLYYDNREARAVKAHDACR